MEVVIMKEPLWRPSEERIKNANMAHFIEFINWRYGKQFQTYDDIYQWSIDKIPDFWESMWEFGEIKASREYDVVVDDLKKMPGARWFIGARLNFAENLLRYRDERVALVARSEEGRVSAITYSDLYHKVG